MPLPRRRNTADKDGKEDSKEKCAWREDGHTNVALSLEKHNNKETFFAWELNVATSLSVGSFEVMEMLGRRKCAVVSP